MREGGQIYQPFLTETVRKVIRRSAVVAIVGWIGELLLFGSTPGEAAMFAVVGAVLYGAASLVIERRLARAKEVP